MASKLLETNVRHHDPELCVCSDCDCGRHLCKVHAIKPDLTMRTSYNSNYHKKLNIPNLIVKPTESGQMKGSHLEMKTSYQSYAGKL